MKDESTQLPLETLLQDFHRITQIGISYLPKASAEISEASFNASDTQMERFLSYLQHPDLKAQETEALSQLAARKDELISFELFPGLTKYVFPVYSRSILLGCFLLGPVRISRGNGQYEQNQRLKLYQMHHLDRTLMEELYEQLPVYDRTAIMAGSRLLTQMAVYASSVASITLHAMPLAQRITEYINTQYMNPISPGTACEHFHISRSTLSRTLSREYGETFLSMLNHCRIRNVCHCLREGLTPDEAAIKTGFSSPQYMTRVFRSIMGCTPHAYIQQESLNASKGDSDHVRP